MPSAEAEQQTGLRNEKPIVAVVPEHPGADTRGRILFAAKRLIGEIGYQKTTVADIANMLKMSPANIYRFFESKRAIYEAVVRCIMGEVEEAVADIAEKPISATQRLRELLMIIHFMNKERYVEDYKLHEMISNAIKEDWKVCDAHLESIGATVAKVLVDGMECGEFKAADPLTTMLCAVSAMARFFYPAFAAQCNAEPNPTLTQMVEFVVNSISAAKAYEYPRP